MRKYIWMNMIYEWIIQSYLVESRPERTIEMMEEVLFLMQIRSIKEGGTPLLRYPIYIHNNQIRIGYISDLLRVAPVLELHREGRFLFEPFNTMTPFSKMLNQLRRLSKEELHEQVQNILINQKLDDTRFFRYERYENNKKHYAARLKSNENQHGIQNLLRLLIGAFGISTVIVMIMIFPISESRGLPILMDHYIGAGLFGIVFLIIYIVWTWKWFQPTVYEKEHEDK